MEFVRIDFPESIFSSEGARNSFYEDALPNEQIEAVGMFLSPVFSENPNEKPTGTQR